MNVPASPSDDDIRRECRALTRYLSGFEPSPYVENCYRRLRPTADAVEDLPIDRILVAVARAGSLGARIADGYARLARPTGRLRRRLTLLLAILENSPGFFEPVTKPSVGGSVTVIVALAGQLIVSGLALLVGALSLGPAHLVTSALSRSSGAHS